MSLKTSAILLAALALCAAAAAGAATVDPVLRGLQRQKSSPGIWYDRLLAVETDAATGDLRVGVILDLAGPLPDLSGVEGLVVGSVVGDVATARLPLRELDRLAAIAGIEHIHGARVLRPLMDLAAPAAGVDAVWNGTPAYTGAGVLVGVIDTGIDWRHDDFRHANGNTRIKAIWEDGPVDPTIWTEDQINAALAGGAPVSQRDTEGHGTHVSGIAAGNGRAAAGQYRGVAYDADILFAKAFVDGGFPEDATIEAMDWLVQQAQQRGQPIVINMSLGGHFGPHDGTSPQERVIDDLSGQGVVFCVAAGNEGEDFIADTCAAGNGSTLLRVPPYDANPGVANDSWVISLWYDGASSMDVRLIHGEMTTAWLSTGESGTLATPDGFITVDNSSAGVHPSNGDRLCLIQVDDSRGADVGDGDWTIEVTGGSGTAHAWLVHSSMLAGFPGSDQSYSLGMPAGAEECVSVAAWKTRNSWQSIAGSISYSGSWGAAEIGDLAPFSSRGPTRDGRQKPDVTAPGMAIISCYSADTDPPAADHFVLTGRDYFVTQGTSMATPLVAGVVALMLEKDGELTADQVRSILRSTAEQDDFTGPGWNNRFGRGKVDAFAALSSIAGSADADGDVDGDDATTVLDVVLLVNHVVDPVGHPLTAEQATAADAFPPGGGDDQLTVADVVRIVAFILGTAVPGREIPAPPATIAIGEPYAEDGLWWVDATLAGDAVAGGQFALTLPGAGWRPADLRCAGDHDTAAVAAVAGDQIRVMVYDLDNRLPTGGVTVRVPFTAPPAGEPTITGLLVADPQGWAREVEIMRGTGVLPPVRFVQVAPNPAPGDATVAFQLGRRQDVRVGVYDLKGRRIRELTLGALSPGAHAVGWDGRDEKGCDVPAGVYLVRLVTPEQSETRKVMVAR